MRMRVPRPRSSLLIGYIDAQLGLGQSLRGLALAMSRSAAEFSIYPFGVGVEERRGVAYMPERYDLAGSHAVNVIEVMPDELPTVFDHVSREHFDRSYNVLRTYWELAKAPEVWRQHLVTIDEIWAPNAFVAESFRPIFDRAAIAAADEKRPPAERIAAVQLLGSGPYSAGAAVWPKLLAPDVPSDVQLAAVRALGRHDRPVVALGDVELRRRHAEVEQDAVDLRDPLACENLGELIVVAVDEPGTVGERAQNFSAGGKRSGVAIDADQGRPGGVGEDQ